MLLWLVAAGAACVAEVPQQREDITAAEQAAVCDVSTQTDGIVYCEGYGEETISMTGWANGAAFTVMAWRDSYGQHGNCGGCSTALVDEAEANAMDLCENQTNSLRCRESEEDGEDCFVGSCVETHSDSSGCSVACRVCQMQETIVSSVPHPTNPEITLLQLSCTPTVKAQARRLDTIQCGCEADNALPPPDFTGSSTSSATTSSSTGSGSSGAGGN